MHRGARAERSRDRQKRSAPEHPGQPSGFFVVSCDDHQALVDAAHVLTAAHPVVEIRAVHHC